MGSSFVHQLKKSSSPSPWLVAGRRNCKDKKNGKKHVAKPKEKIPSGQWGKAMWPLKKKGPQAALFLAFAPATAGGEGTWLPQRAGRETR